jgi:hypothetical protein
MRAMLRGAFLAMLAASPAHALRTQSAGDPRLDRESARAAQALTDSARAERLPAKALTGVLQEGLSQHANGTRIVHAMQDYLRALRGAATALGANSTETELVSGAGDLLAGVSPAALTQIRAARGKEPVVVPLVVLGDLVARGVPAAAAGVAIAEAARSGLPDEQFNTLRQRVEQDIASGVAAGTALESVARRFLTPTAPTPADSMARRRKPPGDSQGFARVQLAQIGGGPAGALSELRAEGVTPLGAHGPFEFAGDARALGGGTMNAPGALVNASFLATAKTGNFGIGVGPGARALSVGGASGVSPTLQANAWHRSGPWSFSLSAAFGGVPAGTLTTAALNARSASIARAGSGIRFDAAPADTTIVHTPSTPSTPRTTTPTDSSVQQASGALLGTATEARFAITRHLGQFEFEGAAGVRSYAVHHADAWSSASVAMTLFDRVDVVAGGVVGPENVLAPVSGSRFFAGIRLATGSSLTPAPPVPKERATLAFRVVPGVVTTTLEIRAPGARSVELVGDFTDWVPLALSTSGGGEWSVTRAIEPGIHRVRVRINGGEWSPPPGLPRSLDMFGGEVGVLTIGVL